MVEVSKEPICIGLRGDLEFLDILIGFATDRSKKYKNH